MSRGSAQRRRSPASKCGRHWLGVAAAFLCAFLVVAPSCGGQPALSETPSVVEPAAPSPEASTPDEPDAGQRRDATVPPDDASEADEDAEDRDAPPLAAPPLAAPSLANAGADVCAIEDSSEVVSGSADKRMTELELAFGPRGGVLAWPRDTKSLAVIGLDRAGVALGSPHVVELSLAQGLDRIVPVGDRFLVISMHFCPDRLVKIASDQCAFARVLGSDGRPQGAELLTKLGPYGHLAVQSATADEALMTSTDPARGIISLLRFRIAPDGTLTSEVVESFHRHEWGAGHDFNAGVCDVVDDHLVVISANRMASHLSTLEKGAVQLIGLIPEADVHRCRAEESGVAIIFTRLELGTRRLARFDANGRLRGAPRLLEEGVPAPFADSVVAEVTTSTATGPARWHRKATFHRRLELLGKAVGQGTELATNIGLRDGASVAWTGERFVVALADFQAKGWRLRLMRLRCDTASTPISDVSSGEATDTKRQQ